MSEYTVCELEFRDPESIKAALTEMEYEFEEHEEAQSLFGYQGDKRKQKAHIIVRKKYVGSAANDVGFLKKEDGSYDMIISEYDRRSGSQSTNFMERLKQLYAKNKTLKQAKKMNWMVTSNKTMNDGRLKIKLLVP